MSEADVEKQQATMEDEVLVNKKAVAKSSTPKHSKSTPKKETPKTTPKSTSKAKNEETDDEIDEDEALKPGILDGPLVVEGKRVRQKVERLTTVTPKVEAPKAEEFAGKGKGTALGELGYANEFISNKPAVELKPLHKLLYLKEGQAAHGVIMKRHLRRFNGWWFEKGSADWEKRVAILNRMSVTDVRRLRSNIGVHKAAPSKEDEIAQIMEFLNNPEGISNEKREKAKESSKKRKSTTDVKTPAKKLKKDKHDDIVDSDDSEENNESGENSEDEEDVKKQVKTPKKTPKKTEMKKTPKKEKKKKDKNEEKEKEERKNEAEKEEKEDEDVDSDGSDEKKEDPANDKSPSESVVVKMIKELLKTFDLAEVSMKQMCQAVCDKFPGSDLTERKAFLKEKIKEALAEQE